MKNVAYLLIALVAAWIVWRLISIVIHAILAPIITIGMILLFCFLVYTVYKALSRQKEVI